MKKIIMLLFVFNFLIAGKIYAQLVIPKENIPQDIPIEIREQIELLYSLDVKARESAVEKLGNMREKAIPIIPFLIEMLGDTTIVEKRPFEGNCFPPIPLPIPLSEKVVIALTKIGNSTVNLLTEALKNENPNIRKGAAEVLGKIKDSDSIEILFEKLKDDDFKVRWSAAMALVEYKGLVIDRLLLALNDENAHVRGYSLTALGYIIRSGEIKDNRIFEPTVKALKDVDKYVRRDAANLLGDLKDTRAIEPLIEALKDETWDVKMAAIRALGDLQDNRAVKPLVLMLGDNKHDYDVSKALVKIGKSSVEPLIDALNSIEKENFNFRFYAAKTLGELKDIRAVESLIKLLVDEDHNARESAEEALTKISGQHFGEDKIKWQEWWENNKKTFK